MYIKIPLLQQKLVCDVRAELLNCPQIKAGSFNLLLGRETISLHSQSRTYNVDFLTTTWFY